MKLISGSASAALTEQIAHALNLSVIAADLDIFPNGEKRVWIKDKLRGENICIVQSFSHPTDENIIEFLLLTDALERLGVRHINVIIPWMGYSLQDKVFREGEAIAAKVVANLISHAYVKRVFLLDVHNTSIPGFFSVPTHHLSAQALFIEYARQHTNLSQAVVASPDFGGLKRARVFADQLQLDLVNIDKERNLVSGQVTAVGLSGEVTGKEVILLDDVIVSGSTVIEAGRILKEHGASKVSFLATHGPLVPDAYQKLANSQVDEVVITDSIAHPDLPDKFKVLPTAPIFADELRDWL